VSEVAFQFPITSLWRDYRGLHVTFKSPRGESLCAVPIRLPRCVVGTCGLHLWVSVGKTLQIFRTGLSTVPKARARSLVSWFD